jgi:arylsulfatase A-like enzyme
MVLAASPLMMCAEEAAEETKRPNIVWIMAEDMSTELSCYGEAGVQTLNLDRLAGEGARYTNAFCTAPSCTPSRSAMITGVYQTRIGTQNQRRRIKKLPNKIKPITKLLKDAGYFTALGCGYSKKTDHNFNAPKSDIFDGMDWSERCKDQPFFAQITIYETHRLKPGQWETIRKKSKHPVSPNAVELPPYFPDHPVTRLDWATYLDTIEYMDDQVGKILKRLEDEGIADNTVVIFIGDNGRCHLRGKCWLYDPGIQVPLIIRWPGKVTPKTVVDDMISMIDVSTTILDIAGVQLPEYLDGHPILGPRAKKRNHIFAARDLIDEVMDHIRCVRNKRYKYIRNYTPENGYNECDYVKKHRPMWPLLAELHEQGKLNDVQELLFKKQKPLEELYDLKADPHEINNLAGSAGHQSVKQELSALLDGWIKDTKDKGLKNLEYDQENIIQKRKG